MSTTTYHPSLVRCLFCHHLVPYSGTSPITGRFGTRGIISHYLCNDIESCMGRHALYVMGLVRVIQTHDLYLRLDPHLKRGEE